jgi:hypothetical protein
VTFHAVMNAGALRIERRFDSLAEAERCAEKLADRWRRLVSVAESGPGFYRLLKFAAPLGGPRD